MKHILEQADQIKDRTVFRRRYIHQNPETGFDTQNTENYVKELLRELNIEILPSTVGVLGLIKGNNTNDMVALRADMDALSLTEENEVDYKSGVIGKMHGCGHDGHTAMLMGAAELLSINRDCLKHDVLLVFQPAEEGPDLGGARIMLKDMENMELLPKIKCMYGQHVTTELEIGKVFLKYGSLTASTDEYTIEIIGKGGHAGMPQEAVDAISIASKFIGEMESFMSRRLDPFDPAVFSVGMIKGGSAKNIIAERVELSGTIRCQSEYNRQYILENAEKILKGICLYSGASYNLKVLHGLPPLVTDDNVMDMVKEFAAEILGEENVVAASKASMGAEDFSYFAEKIPSAFIWVGARNEKKGFVNIMHNPRFDFDEDVLPIGVKMLCRFALQD
ncbi:MAG: amidohydrolase [Sedimentibacter sp.]|uniref:M20 metallopeptidase family protein n=1 Tax=Sedimentibacter sp. TaxID=1960295 RepID=UPI0031592048